MFKVGAAACPRGPRAVVVQIIKAHPAGQPLQLLVARGRHSLSISAPAHLADMQVANIRPPPTEVSVDVPVHSLTGSPVRSTGSPARSGLPSAHGAALRPQIAPNVVALKLNTDLKASQISDLGVGQPQKVVNPNDSLPDTKGSPTITVKSRTPPVPPVRSDSLGKRPGGHTAPTSSLTTARSPPRPQIELNSEAAIQLFSSFPHAPPNPAGDLIKEPHAGLPSFESIPAPVPVGPPLVQSAAVPMGPPPLRDYQAIQRLRDLQSPTKS
jgi:hypothetical protein